ncbi:uncharacterized protein IL334_002041 [Kwoniella shivajii]|uniref:Uncharacterized protein n=1 Tax=Kwoniella shivajii TaxID=564305 RepID=A0ABZ1CUT6_9TREE|nr:hypothetical protein IL334_002041 [Kwoniella shivajii]
MITYEESISAKNPIPTQARNEQDDLKEWTNNNNDLNDLDDNYNDSNDNDQDDNTNNNQERPRPYRRNSISSITSRPGLSSRSSSYSSSSEDSLPPTPLTLRFTIKLPSENFCSEKIKQLGIETPTQKRIIKPKPVQLQETPKPQTVCTPVLETPKSQTRTLEKYIQPTQLRTPPNSILVKQVRQPLIEIQPTILRPTTFWRHHPLSPHSLPHHSPASRLIRRSTLIASPTIGSQHPDPDQETTRIRVGLAGLDLDIDPTSTRLSLVPI